HCAHEGAHGRHTTGHLGRLWNEEPPTHRLLRWSDSGNRFAHLKLEPQRYEIDIEHLAHHEADLCTTHSRTDFEKHKLPSIGEKKLEVKRTIAQRKSLKDILREMLDMSMQGFQALSGENVR